MLSIIRRKQLQAAPTFIWMSFLEDGSGMARKLENRGSRLPLWHCSAWELWEAHKICWVKQHFLSFVWQNNVYLNFWTPFSSPENFTPVRWHQTLDVGYLPNQKLPNSFMATALDTYFDGGDIHPQYKAIVAQRLSWAAANQVQKKIPFNTENKLNRLSLLV